MKVSALLNLLFEEIESLYKKVALRMLHRRMTRYHQHINFTSSPHARDIKSPLLDCIDHVAIHKKNGVKLTDVVHDIGSPVLGVGDSEKPKAVSENESEPNPYMLDKKVVNELSTYFKEKKKGKEIHTSINVKLKRSVWEHINAAMSSARKGDKRNAKMHVDIASSAFREVAHYMPET